MRSKACVLIHGFTGSPKEIEIIANHLEEKGIDVVTPTLPGHGEYINRREMRRFTRRDWLESAEKVIKETTESYDEVYLIGFSMGGLISAFLATKYPIKKLVLLSTSVFYLNVHRFVDNMKQKMRSKSQLQRYIYKIKNTPIRTTLQFRTLVKELTPYIEQIDVPTLIIQGEQDDLVDPRSAQYIYEHIQSKEKELHFLPNSKHIICWDSDKEQVVDLVDQFLT